MRRDENDIQEIINHQFKHLNESMKDNNSLEISGFGKLMFRVSVAKKEVVRLYKKIETLSNLEHPTQSQKNAIELIKEDIAYLEYKIGLDGN
ncbi:MAG: hypothetical protein WCP46_00560 [Alphaproteobacteria bacterium]